MYLTDYHTHTLCSPDGSAPLTEMAAAALSAGLSELCVTDHCDLLDLHGTPDVSFRWAPIEEQLSQARPQFQGKLPIKMGLELGEAWTDPEFAQTITAHPDLDFVIGSVHNLGPDQGGIDFYFVRYENEAICHQVLDSYFQCMEALCALDCFDVLGHIIYPLRYMNGRDGNHVTLKPYFPRLEGIFRTLLAHDKAIEVNTCRGTTVEDWREVLSLYRDCGGVFATLGSDAHTPQDVGKGVPQAAGLLKEYGLSLALYEKRQPQLLSL